MPQVPLRVGIVQPVPRGIDPYGHLLAVLIGLDVLANALIGGRSYQTISSRVGENIAAGGVWSRFWLPAWFKRHCANSIYTTTV